MTKTPSFETSMNNLEEVINNLEDESLSLDDAVGQFEQGVSAIRSCQKALSTAEGRLTELMRGEDGALVESLLGLTLDTLLDEEDEDE